MRPTLWMLAACAYRVPAARLPDTPPPLDAADYATGPLVEGSTFQRAAIANLQLGASADGISVVSDERLSRVASRIAWEYARTETPPSPAQVQQLAADAGAPYVIPVVAVSVRPRRDPIAADLYWLHGRAVPGDPLPLVAGVGAWEVGKSTVYALVLARRGFSLEAPVPRGGPAVVPLVGTFDTASYGLLAVDADGVHLSTAPSGEGRTASPSVPVRDGWVEVLAIDGQRSTALGLLRIGAPAPLPAPDPAASTDGERVGSGIERLRAAWGLGPLRPLGGVPRCDVVPDEVEGVEVTRDQGCVAVPVADDAWDAVAQRPLVLRAVADPAAALVQLGIEGDLLTVRTLRPFVRRASVEATEALAAEIEARWPGIRRDVESPFAELARGYAATRDPAQAEGELGLRADEVAARWVGTGGWTRVLAASQDLVRLLDVAKPERPVGYAVGVVLGEGPAGEPMYYAAIGFRQ